MGTLLGIICLLCVYLPVITPTDDNKCIRDYEKMGCVDEGHTDMDLIVYDRHKIDWGNFPASVRSMVCRCTKKGKAMGYTYFSIRFWGECWAGKDFAAMEAVLAQKSKEKTNCAGVDYKKCNDSAEEECVGTKFSEYVFKIRDPVDGGFTEWSSFNECSPPCNGTQYRTRSCTNPSPKFGGKDCLGERKEAVVCNSGPCPDYFEKNRTKEQSNFQRLTGIESKVDGGFSEWSTFTPCSVSCGWGRRKRTRTCTNPKPSHGGKPCYGDYEEVKICIRPICPVHGGLTSWSDFSKCSVSCGGGNQTRTRSCTNPRPAHGGRDCNGTLSESRLCKTQPCPVNGGLTSWSNFTKCSVSCGGGNQTRTRSCTNPRPAHGGRKCNGTLSESKLCSTQPCPVNGGLTSWSNFTKCSVSCGGGRQTRTRSCTNPRPAHGGRKCNGSLSESKLCGSHPCPVDGGLSSWSNFTACSVTCGNGKQKRHRSCTNPPPSHGGKDCDGPLEEERVCSPRQCPVNGGFTSWSSFSRCTKTCGGGYQSRSRSCTNPPPSHGGADCVGSRSETRRCNTQTCQCFKYRFLGRRKGCHSHVYTHIPGRCDGWPHVGMEECKRKCNRNEAPGGCPSRPCKYVIWDTNYHAGGWCQLATDGCRIGPANYGHHLFVRSC